MSGGGFLKKAICLLLSVVLVVCPVLSVSAAEMETENSLGADGGAADAAVWIKYVFTQMGAVVTGSFDDVINNSDALKEYLNNGVPHTDDGKGNIMISGDTVNNIYNAVKDQLPALDGYYLLTPKVDISEWFYHVEGAGLSVLENIKNFINTRNGGIIFECPPKFSLQQFYAPAKSLGTDVWTYLVGQSGGYLSAYNSSFYRSPDFVIYKMREYGYIQDSVNIPLKFDEIINSYMGTPTKCFYTLADLKRYVMGGSSVFPTSNFINFDPLKDNKIVFNKQEVKKQDWDKIGHEIAQAIKDSLKDFNGTEEERQVIVDSKSDEILGALGDIGGGIDNVNNNLNSWLSRIYGKVDAILSVVQNPTKILDLIGAKADMIGTKIQGVIDAVKGIDVSGGGGLGNVIGSALGTLLGNLLDKIIGGGEEAVTDAVQELATTFAPMIDVSKTRFPFSIPWDFGAVILLFAAKPEVPKFEIPFKLYDSEQMISIDLTPFERMSDLSRTMFTILFVVALMSFTIRLIGKGGD